LDPSKASELRPVFPIHRTANHSPSQGTVCLPRIHLVVCGRLSLCVPKSSINPGGNDRSRLDTRSVISVIIPAHNEASVIGRLLAGLLADAHADEFQILVIANGCSDDTAAIAGAHEPTVQVVSTSIASKSHALKLGDTHARGFPRLYVDADVELGTADARALADTLRQPGVLAAAPERVLTMDGRTLTVRWYYDIWSRLPTVQGGLFGRGVIAVSEAGHKRLVAVPQVMNDDLAASVAFTPDERRVVSDARVVIHPPRTMRDLLRRRVRALTGIAQLQGQMEGLGGARTTRSDLLGIVRAKPAMALRMAVFLGVTAAARWKARRPIRSGDFTTWLRDDSSRDSGRDTDRAVG
jgi:Glycosyl transferase family 2